MYERKENHSRLQARAGSDPNAHLYAVLCASYVQPTYERLVLSEGILREQILWYSGNRGTIGLAGCKGMESLAAEGLEAEG